MRPLVPHELSILQFVPGYTIGGLFLTQYGAGSVLEYNELVLVTAATLYRGRIAWHVSDILVDIAAALDGGRSELGVPKRMAEFYRSEDSIEIHCNGSRYLTWRWERPWWTLRTRSYFEAVNRDAVSERSSTIRVCGGEVDGVVGTVRSEVHLWSTPVTHIFPQRPLITVAAKQMKAILGYRIQ